MFYERDEDRRAVVVLTPSESKRLIARAVVKISEVSEAMGSGRIVIIGSSTNAFVREELTGEDVDKFQSAVGRITKGELSAIKVEDRLSPLVLIDGLSKDITPKEALEGFTAKDVYVKGANAVDIDGNVGILLSSDYGGTIAMALGVVTARGANLIVPVGLEKLVPSVVEAAEALGGQGRIDFSTGEKVALMVLTSAKVVTEIEAIDILFGAEVTATHVASGGIGGSEGSVTLVLNGTKASVKDAFDYISNLKGEPAIYPKG
ncbi:MAG: hypothetical protein KAS88_01930 [Deltaproteobacteria bacterium]|nr:hypothetical protein [Deltaproteobacteria bacterium]